VIENTIAFRSADPRFKLEIAGPPEPTTVYMPVPFRLTLTNVSSDAAKTHTVLDRLGGVVDAYVENEQGIVLRWSRKWERFPDSVFYRDREIPPGAVHRGSFEVYGHPKMPVFERPGYYLIRAVWQGSTGRAAAQCLIKVAPEEPRDRECLAEILAAGLEPYLALEGVKVLQADVVAGRRTNWAEPLQALATVVERYPDSQYAKHAMCTLMLALPSKPGASVDEPRWKRLDALVRERMKRETDPRLLYGYACYLRWTDWGLADQYAARGRSLQPTNPVVMDRLLSLGGSDKSKPLVPAP
jgi:hypothetical protein